MADKGLQTIIREYSPSDVPALISLWEDTFGDSKEFISDFFDMLPQMGTCILAERNGTIIAEASVITELEIISDVGMVFGKCAYIYAVAADKKHRGEGLGIDVSRAAYNYAKDHGIEIICTLPADNGLYSFYNKACGFDSSLHRRKYTVPAWELGSAEKIDYSEYISLREKMLIGTHMKPSAPVMKFADKLCKYYGGGLYSSESGICMAQVEGNICIIYEIISSSDKSAESLAADTAAVLGCLGAVYYLPDENGEKYIAFESGKIPEKTFWGIAFE